MKRNDPSQTPAAPPAKRSRVQKCPYLDTVNRQLLDFDFEKVWHTPAIHHTAHRRLTHTHTQVCSVTLATTNVYACMVCGKYFQGRGVGTPARVHSLDCDHHVFINLETRKIYCLPDDYEVDDPSFDDVKVSHASRHTPTHTPPSLVPREWRAYNGTVRAPSTAVWRHEDVPARTHPPAHTQYLLSPTFTEEDIAKLGTVTKPIRCFAGLAEYFPGFCGLNNVKATDYVNVVVQALVHVEPLRDFLLLHHDTKVSPARCLARHTRHNASLAATAPHTAHTAIPHECVPPHTSEHHHRSTKTSSTTASRCFAGRCGAARTSDRRFPRTSSFRYPRRRRVPSHGCLFITVHHRHGIGTCCRPLAFSSSTRQHLRDARCRASAALSSTSTLSPLRIVHPHISSASTHLSAIHVKRLHPIWTAQHNIDIYTHWNSTTQHWSIHTHHNLTERHSHPRQSVQFDSHKRFMITAQSDPVELLQWVLNTLNIQLRTKRQPSMHTPHHTPRHPLPAAQASSRRPSRASCASPR